jgi:hypothetical protein
MANIAHENILDPYIHEPKGLSTATGSGKSYITTSSGAASWENLNARGLVSLVNLAAPIYTTTTIGTYEKINPTTSGSGTSVEFDEVVNSQLTYTGGLNRKALLTATVTFKGANNSVYHVAIYKNGIIIPHSEIAVTTVTGDFNTITICAHTVTNTSDFYETKINCITTNATVYGYTLYATAGA